jgi:hypothetical protein
VRVLGQRSSVFSSRLDAAAASDGPESPPRNVRAWFRGDLDEIGVEGVADLADVDSIGSKRRAGGKNKSDFDEVGREGVGDFGDVDVAVCGRGRDGGSRREDESGVPSRG